MNLTRALQELDTLIVDITVPPVTAKLRNKLQLLLEQIEAYQASADKQEETLSRQAETIAKLQTQNQSLVAENAELIKLHAAEMLAMKESERKAKVNPQANSFTIENHSFVESTFEPEELG